jgi:hypothetical protein
MASTSPSGTTCTTREETVTLGTMRDRRAAAATGRRLVLLAVAALLCVAAALAIGILLFGEFGPTEVRILGTIAILAGYGLAALPAAMLQDQRRLPGLVVVVVALAIAGASLTIALIWTDEPPDALGKAVSTVIAWLAAVVQVAALTLRRHEQDPGSVRWLFAASSVLVVVLAAMLTGVFWAEIDSEAFARAFGALVVLDALLVALQPIIARARPTRTVHRLRVVVAPGETVELSIEAADFADAASQAIRTLEHDGRRILRVEFADREAAPSGASAESRLPASVE